MHIYIYIYIPDIGIIVRMFAKCPVQSQVMSYQRLKKWYLMPPCLTLSIIRYRSKVKGGKPGKRAAPSSTLWCSSYRKGRLGVTLDNGLIYIYIYLYGLIYHARTITSAYYADDIALLVNTPTQVESLLHSLEQAAGGISLHVNANKTELMCFNQRSDISTLNGISLKLVNKFTFLGSSVLSTKNDINTQVAKAWIAIDRLSVIWKSYLSDKIKRSFFPSRGRVNTAVWMHHMDADLAYGEEA